MSGGGEGSVRSIWDNSSSVSGGSCCVDGNGSDKSCRLLLIAMLRSSGSSTSCPWISLVVSLIPGIWVILAWRCTGGMVEILCCCCCC